MASVVYLLCTLTSAICAFLLTRAWWRSREWLLFWSSLCFCTLMLSNLLLLLDFTIFLDVVDLSNARAITALVGPTLLLFGLIWEVR